MLGRLAVFVSARARRKRLAWVCAAWAWYLNDRKTRRLAARSVAERTLLVCQQHKLRQMVEVAILERRASLLRQHRVVRRMCGVFAVLFLVYMYVYVCMYVCIYVCMCVCVCVYLYIHLYI